MTSNNPEQNKPCERCKGRGVVLDRPLQKGGGYPCPACSKSKIGTDSPVFTKAFQERLKPEWLENHFCRFNDGEHSCECFVDGYKTGKGQVKLDLSPEPPEINTASDYLALGKGDKSKIVRKAVEAANAEQRAQLEPPEPWEELLEQWILTQHGTAGWEEKLKAFIRKVAQQAYERGFNDCSKTHYEP